VFRIRLVLAVSVGFLLDWGVRVCLPSILWKIFTGMMSLPWELIYVLDIGHELLLQEEYASFCDLFNWSSSRVDEPFQGLSVHGLIITVCGLFGFSVVL